MTVKFITVKGQGNLAATPFYVGFVQHERTMSITQDTERMLAIFMKTRSISRAQRVCPPLIF